MGISYLYLCHSHNVLSLTLFYINTYDILDPFGTEGNLQSVASSQQVDSLRGSGHGRAASVDLPMAVRAGDAWRPTGYCLLTPSS